MIIEYKNIYRTYRFVDREQLIKDRNIYTVIVGKNGTGKSTLMNAVIKNILPDIKTVNPFYQNPRWHLYNRSVLSNGKKGVSSDVLSINVNGNVIAYSISPFDKFPLLKGGGDFVKYNYLGVRDSSSFDIGLSFFSKIIDTLIKSISNNKKQAIEICRVLSYLNYEKHISIYFRGDRERFYRVHELLKTSENHIMKEDFDHSNPSSKDRLRNGSYLTHFIEECIKLFSFSRLLEFVEIVLKLPYKSLYVSIHELGLSSSPETEVMSYLDIFLYFYKRSMFELRSAKIFKDKNPISVNSTSSGELNVILCMLGLASCIVDDSVIFIDEPEISLHPEWQEKFMEFLINIFDHLKNCHFIIATHSPQIISKLEAENCFILSMESGELKNAENFKNHSADFQLTNIFNFPGFRNEYLTRIAITTFTKVNARRMFDEDDLRNYSILSIHGELLKDEDPVKDLYLAIKELYKLYV